MNISGKVYQQVETEFADIKVVDMPNYKQINVIIGGEIAMQFPMLSTVDSNEIALRVSNIINQTGFFLNGVRCEAKTE